MHKLYGAHNKQASQDPIFASSLNQSLVCIQTGGDRAPPGATQSAAEWVYRACQWAHEADRQLASKNFFQYSELNRRRGNQQIALWD